MSTNTKKLADKQPLQNMQSVDNVVVTNGGEVNVIPKNSFVPNKTDSVINKYVSGSTVGALKQSLNNAISGNNFYFAHTFNAVDVFVQHIDNNDFNLGTGSQWTFTKVSGHDGGTHFVILAVNSTTDNLIFIRRLGDDWSARRLTTTTI